jgi:putative transposase
VGKKTGANPTDRAKRGVKRSLLCDGRGVPLGLVVDGANRHDMRLVEATLDSIPIKRPRVRAYWRQHLCLDKGYDFDDVRELLLEFGYTPHIRARGEEARQLKQRAGFKARRWVVERTHSWFNRFRYVLVRWSKQVQNYLGLLHLVCAIVTFRHAAVLG